MKIIKLSENEKISLETSAFIQNISMYELGYSRIQLNEYEEILIDSDLKFNFDSLFNNGDLSIAPENIYRIWKDKSEFDLSDYSVFYNYSDKVYVSKNSSPFQNNSSKINCTIFIPDAINLNTTFVPEMKKFSKINHFYRYGIGLKDKILYSIYEKDKELVTSLISNFWISKDLTINSEYLIIENFFHTMFTVYHMKYLYNQMSLTLEQDVLFSNLNIDPLLLDINDVGIYQDIYIIATSNQLIFARQIQDTSFNCSKHNGNFSSLFIFDKTLYTIAVHDGLYIFNLSDITQPPTIIKHPNMLNIDYSQNPFTGNGFIGILLDTSKNTDEFFIELLIKSPFHLVINKIYCLRSNNIKSYTTPDAFFSYFYNERNNRIYRIRRGILNRIGEIIVSTQMETNIQSMSSYYDEKQEKVFPAFVTSESFGYFNMTQLKTTFSCKIKTPGTYQFQYSRFTDACASNIQETPLCICRKIIYYKVNVKGMQLSLTLTVIIITVSVAFVLIIILVVVLCGRYNNWFTDNKLKLLKIDKNQRSELYKDNIETNVTENQLAQHKPTYQNINNNDMLSDPELQTIYPPSNSHHNIKQNNGINQEELTHYNNTEGPLASKSINPVNAPTVIVISRHNKKS